MIPSVADSELIVNDFKITSNADRTTKTYYMRMSEDNRNNRVRYYVDGKNAIQQLIFKTLQTERYDHPAIYSDNFGVEFKDLIGKSAVYAVPEIERRIREALTWDERITDVNNFTFKVEKNSVLVNFVANTTYGALQVNNIKVSI